MGAADATPPLTLFPPSLLSACFVAPCAGRDALSEGLGAALSLAAKEVAGGDAPPVLPATGTLLVPQEPTGAAPTPPTGPASEGPPPEVLPPCRGPVCPTEDHGPEGGWEEAAPRTIAGMPVLLGGVPAA